MSKIAALVLALATLIAIGCANWSQTKRGYAAGKVPCMTSDIDADNTPAEQLGGSMTFTVGCRGDNYVCSRECTSYNGFVCANAQTSCVAVAPTKVARTEDAASASDGSVSLGEGGRPIFKGE